MKVINSSVCNLAYLDDLSLLAQESEPPNISNENALPSVRTTVFGAAAH